MHDLSGFCPSDVVETAQADMIFEACSDLRLSLLKPNREKDESKKVNCTVVITKHSVRKLKQRRTVCGPPSYHPRSFML